MVTIKLYSLAVRVLSFVGSGATLTLKNVVLRNITASNFYCIDETSTIIFDNVVLALALSDYSFNAGSFNVVGLLHIMGPYGFNYQSNQTSMISSNGTLFIHQGSKFNYNPSVSAATLFAFADAISSFIMRSATLEVSDVGLQLTKGFIEFDGKCYIVTSGMSESQGLVLGDGVSSLNNVIVRILPEAVCEVVSGYLVDKSV